HAGTLARGQFSDDIDPQLTSTRQAVARTRGPLVRIAQEFGRPFVMENVREAESWIGPARWHYGSRYLLGRCVGYHALGGTLLQIAFEFHSENRTRENPFSSGPVDRAIFQANGKSRTTCPNRTSENFCGIALACWPGQACRTQILVASGVHGVVS